MFVIGKTLDCSAKGLLSSGANDTSLRYAPALFAILKIGWVSLPGTKSLIYFKSLKGKNKYFLTLATAAIVLNLILFVSDKDTNKLDHLSLTRYFLLV